MAKSRKQYSSAYKAKVALEAVKGELTMAELSSKYGVHRNQIIKWKEHLLKEVSSLFSDKRKEKKEEGKTNEEELYRQIGKLNMELEWMKKKSESLC